MPAKLKKVSPGIKRQRMTIKTFRDREAACAFQNKQPNNDWTEYTGDLKAGVYAYAGGQWHNVKTLDATVLAHI